MLKYMYLIGSVCILFGSLHSHYISLQFTGHAHHHVQRLCDLEGIADRETHEAGTDGEMDALPVDPLDHSKQGSKQNDQVSNEL